MPHGLVLHRTIFRRREPPCGARHAPTQAPSARGTKPLWAHRTQRTLKMDAKGGTNVRQNRYAFDTQSNQYTEQISQ